MIKKICKVCGKEFEAVESREACCSEACKDEYVARNSHMVYNSDYVLDKYGNVYLGLGSDIDEDYYDEDGWHYADEDIEDIDCGDEYFEDIWGDMIF